jgi:hypothetical protein
VADDDSVQVRVLKLLGPTPTRQGIGVGQLLIRGGFLAGWAYWVGPFIVAHPTQQAVTLGAFLVIVAAISTSPVGDREQTPKDFPCGWQIAALIAVSLAAFAVAFLTARP